VIQTSFNLHEEAGGQKRSTKTRRRGNEIEKMGERNKHYSGRGGA
jgi:hypothetical protein